MSASGQADSGSEVVAARLAAFGETPERPVHAAACSTDPVARWLAAVALGGRGHYAAAATVLEGLVGEADPVLASLAASTLASHRRQLGGHAAARAWDARALRLVTGPTVSEGRTRLGRPDPDGMDVTGARVDALLGLAADAIGLGRVDEARRLHAVAVDTAVAAEAGWRSEVRLAWVAAEVALAADDPGTAVRHAERALERTDRSVSVRHRVKSAMVLGAALATAGDPAAEAVLEQAVDLADRHRLVPLFWPAALLLDQLRGGASPLARRARKALDDVLLRADPVARELAVASPWIPTECSVPAINPTAADGQILDG
ncbi:MAG TPA: hypothetical protein VIL00_05995 [Pseudonocardiaceae bacterium]